MKWVNHWPYLFCFVCVCVVFVGKQGSVAASGIRIGDKKFISIGGIPGECLRGRKGAGGCTIKKTNTAMVIGLYDEGVQGGDCNVIVENLGDYLIGQNI